jgi:hypothetical protein
LARAAEHFAAARYAEAYGAYRAVLSIDPSEPRAHIGLAECGIARGQWDVPLEELVATARAFAEQGNVGGAFALLGHALGRDPSRLELHIDIAELEAGLGQLGEATCRLSQLSQAYGRAGRHEEADAVLEVVAAWTHAAASAPIVLSDPAAPGRTEPGRTEPGRTDLRRTEPGAAQAVAPLRTMPLVHRQMGTDPPPSSSPPMEPLRTGETQMIVFPLARPTPAEVTQASALYQPTPRWVVSPAPAPHRKARSVTLPSLCEPSRPVGPTVRPERPRPVRRSAGPRPSASATPPGTGAAATSRRQPLAVGSGSELAARLRRKSGIHDPVARVSAKPASPGAPNGELDDDKTRLWAPDHLLLDIVVEETDGSSHDQL